MTHSEYREGLSRIERDNPREPLLPTLRTGFTRVTILYMQAALKNLPIGHITLKTGMATSTGETVTVTFPAPAPGAIGEASTDDVLKRLYTEQQVLRGEKAKLSNSFHGCKTKEERREVSRQILEKDAVIRANEGKIAHYKAHQVLPTEDDPDALPDDPIVLMKKRNSIAAQISQTKKTLDGLGALADSDPERLDIPKYEARLQRLKLLKGHADQKISAAGI